MYKVFITVESDKAPQVSVEHENYIYVLEHNHRYGTDLSAYLSEKAAWDAVFAFLEEEAGELKECGKSEQFVDEFKKKVRDRNSEVIEIWTESTEEFVYVHKLKVQNAPDTSK